MRATVRRFHSPDVDLETFAPDDPSDVEVLIQIMAGPTDGPGDESFDVLVCTPRRLMKRTHDRGPIVGRHYLVVHEWDWPRIRLLLTAKVEALEEPTWRELAVKIGRVGKWEFEDYNHRS